MIRTSFLIPVRNGEHTLAEAMASVLAQTDPDLELVVVDDGSTDRSAQVAESFDDPRVRVLHGPGDGLVAALNQGMAACRGRYIARLDSDDRAVPHRLERQIPLLEGDRDLGVVDGRVRFFRDEGDVPQGMRRYEHWVNAIVEPADFDRELLIECPVVQPAATIRRAALDQVGGYRWGDFPEDFDLYLRLHAAGWRLRKVPEVLVEMRDRPARLTRTDPRYRVEAFDVVRREWLAATVLSERRRVVLIGSGKRSRSWNRWLRDHHELVAIVDVRGDRPERAGVPVVGPDGIDGLRTDVALVAVGSVRVHPEIRRWLQRERPDWLEGRHWWFV